MVTLACGICGYKNRSRGKAMLNKIVNSPTRIIKYKCKSKKCGAILAEMRLNNEWVQRWFEGIKSYQKELTVSTNK